MQANNPMTVLYKNPSSLTSESEWQPATSKICLHSVLGNRVNLQWTPSSGILKIWKAETTQEKTGYEMREDGIQIIKGAYFQHGDCCPLLREDIEKNQKCMKACACVMLYNRTRKQFLMTERSASLRTYPNAWVLPGGHLEAGEGVFQGGIRECCEEVGLPADKQISKPIKQNCIMVWESVFAVENSVKATAIVIFFVAQCKQFDVKTDPKEVSAYKWKSIQDQSDQIKYSSKTKQGYAEGHLRYLNTVRKSHIL